MAEQQHARFPTTGKKEINVRSMYKAEIRHLGEAQQCNSFNARTVLVYKLKQTFLLTVSNLGIDILTIFIPFIMVAGDELSLPTET